MKPGKIASQVSHASMKVLLDRGHIYYNTNGESNWFHFRITKEMQEWLSGKFTKICLAVNSEEELFEFYNAATVAGLPCAIIKDSGDTVFNGVPTNTCVAIGPDDADKIDKITRGLKLL